MINASDICYRLIIALYTSTDFSFDSTGQQRLSKTEENLGSRLIK